MSTRTRMREALFRSPESHAWSHQGGAGGNGMGETPVCGPHFSLQPAWASKALQTPQQATDTDQRGPGLVLALLSAVL